MSLALWEMYITAQEMLRNDLYCVEWDVKLYYTIPYHTYRKTKICTEVGHVTRNSDTTFKVKRSKVNLPGAGAYWGGLPHSLLMRQRN